MRYIFYDTETTGLKRSDEVIEFGAIVADENLNAVAYENFYCYTQVPLQEDVIQIHGIDAGLLWKLSGGKTFEDNFYDLPFLKEEDLVWVSYSTGKFDERMINQTLKNNGLPAYDFGSSISNLSKTVKGVHLFEAYPMLKNRCFNGKNKKLGVAVRDSVSSDDDKIRHLFTKVTGLQDSKAAYHGALFDAFCLYLLILRHARELGLSEL